MGLREKLMHYTHDLDCGADLKQEAIATIEHIAQYMDEDELLHHSRPLAIAYLALTEDAAVPVTHGRWVDGKCSNCGVDIPTDDAHDAIFEDQCRFCYYCGARMDGGDSDEAD